MALFCGWCILCHYKWRSATNIFSLTFKDYRSKCLCSFWGLTCESWLKNELFVYVNLYKSHKTMHCTFIWQLEDVGAEVFFFFFWSRSFICDRKTDFSKLPLSWQLVSVLGPWERDPGRQPMALTRRLSPTCIIALRVPRTVLWLVLRGCPVSISSAQGRATP